MQTGKIISVRTLSSILLNVLLAAFLLSANSLAAQNKVSNDTISTGLYAEAEKIVYQQKHLQQEDSLTKVELLGRLQLNEGAEAIMLLGKIDSLDVNDSISQV